MKRSSRHVAWLLALLPLLTVSVPQAVARSPAADLQSRQDVLAANVRWGDIEAATRLLDPSVPRPDALALERFKQVRVSSYRVLGADAPAKGGDAMRDIEIGVVNNHTMAERQVRVRETWRYDPVAKHYWLLALPDLWDGQ